MAFPLQSSQQRPNYPPDRFPVSPGPFIQGTQGLEGAPMDSMQPAGATPSAPKRNKIQTMLAKFLPMGGAQQSTDLPAQAAGGAKATGVDINSMLSNVQQVLNIVHQTAPIVKEYGPMVKNIPTMIRMVKAFNSLDDEEYESNTEEKQVTQPEERIEETQKTEGEHVEETASQTVVPTETETTTRDGGSKPLLFI